jgi:hypothetical protein
MSAPNAILGLQDNTYWDVEAIDPSTGVVGDVPTVTDIGGGQTRVQMQAAPTGLPAGGTVEHFLWHDGTSAVWRAIVTAGGDVVVASGNVVVVP